MFLSPMSPKKESDAVKNILRHATLFKDGPTKDVFLEHLN